MSGTPTSKLRFVERNGKKILQQEWLLPIIMPEKFDMSLVLKGLPTEWRDIPLEKEETKTGDE